MSCVLLAKHHDCSCYAQSPLTPYRKLAMCVSWLRDSIKSGPVHGSCRADVIFLRIARLKIRQGSSSPAYVTQPPRGRKPATANSKHECMLIIRSICVLARKTRSQLKCSSLEGMQCPSLLTARQADKNNGVVLEGRLGTLRTSNLALRVSARGIDRDDRLAGACCQSGQNKDRLDRIH